MAFEELIGSGIHRLENVLTLNSNAHILFDTLKLWLEPVEAVSNSAPCVNGSFNWASRIYPTPTNPVRFIHFISVRVGSLL